MLRSGTLLRLGLLVALTACHLGATSMSQQEKPKQQVKTWDAQVMKELLEKRARSERSYLQFLKVPTLSCGIYHLEKGSVDGQSPHDEDEV